MSFIRHLVVEVRKIVAKRLNGSLMESKARVYDTNRRELWIKAVGRVNKDGSLWEPTKHSVVCSLHFQSGKPFNHPRNPDFAPNVFRTGSPPSCFSNAARNENLENRQMKMEIGQMPQLRVRLCRNCIDCKHQRDFYLRRFKKFEQKLGEIATNQNAILLRDAEEEIHQLKEILSQKIKLQEEKKMKLENERNNTMLGVQEDTIVSHALQSGGTVTQPLARPRKSERASYQICRWTIHKQSAASKVCRQVFTTSELLTHISEEHTGKTCLWHECQLYGLPFKDAEELLGHIRFHVYRCNVFGCSKGFSCSQDLEEHKLSHKKAPKEVALNKVAVEEVAVKEVVVRDVEVYRCVFDGCRMSFDTAHAIACHHYSAHCNDEQNFQCTIPGCNMVLETKSNLEEHMKIHLNYRPLQCEFPGCYKPFKYYTSLLMHYETHFGK